MTGGEKTFQVIVFLALIINLLLNILLIPVYGIIGAAFATLFSVGFWNLVSVYYVYRYYNILTIYWPGKIIK